MWNDLYIERAGSVSDGGGPGVPDDYARRGTAEYGLVAVGDYVEF